jgi:hypothetical protein
VEKLVAAGPYDTTPGQSRHNAPTNARIAIAPTSRPSNATTRGRHQHERLIMIIPVSRGSRPGKIVRWYRVGKFYRLVYCIGLNLQVTCKLIASSVWFSLTCTVVVFPNSLPDCRVYSVTDRQRLYTRLSGT